eukprot:jgi/Galph1/6110/GphlegSOOS_G4756.1
MNVMRVGLRVTKRLQVSKQRCKGKQNLAKSFQTNRDQTYLAIRDFSQQRFSCRIISKRSPSISDTISRNNCAVRDSGRASLATAAADSSTKGLACLETVQGAVPLAKSLSVVGIDSDESNGTRKIATFPVLMHVVGNSVITLLLRLAHGISKGNLFTLIRISNTFSISHKAL